MRRNDFHFGNSVFHLVPSLLGRTTNGTHNAPMSQCDRNGRLLLRVCFSAGERGDDTIQLIFYYSLFVRKKY